MQHLNLTILAEIAHLFRERLAQSLPSLPSAQAATLADALVDELSERYEGCQLYIPKRTAHARAQRDAAIIRALDDGANHADLARIHRLTIAQIYGIVRRSTSSEIVSSSP